MTWRTPEVFAVMRALAERAERRIEASRRLMPRYGEVAVGGAHMDDFFHGNALEVTACK